MINTIKIDEIYDANIEGLENEGAGVCRINGMVVFVPKALTGEKVRIRITEIKKNYAKGKVIEVLEKSKHRVDSGCPYYEECGGCNLRHQDSKENLKFKKEKVENAIKRIGKLDIKVNDVVSSFRDDNYRNKASFKVENNKIGFYSEGTYQLVDIKECKLMKKEINDSLYYIRKYLEENKNEIKNVTVKYGNAINEILIDIYSVNESDINICDFLINNLSSLKTIIFNDKIVYQNGYISQIINGLMFNCSAKSFFQVNDMQAEKLYNLAIKSANLKKSDTVLDLYCGTGTISCIVSSHVKKVIGVEIVEDAVRDAKCNLMINNINNVKFIVGDAAKKVSKIKEKVDVIFVDPPRSGMDRKMISIIKNIKAEKIVYISCNPVTMARDLNYLSDTYITSEVTPVDMFPNTAHVECVILLQRKD